MDILIVASTLITLSFTGLYLLRRKHLTDLAAREQVIKELQTTQQRYHELVETASNATLQIDQTGKITFASSATITVFCHESERILGMEWWELVHPKHRQRLKRNFARWGNFATQSHEKYECKVIGCNGTEFDLLWNVYIIYRDNDFVGLNVIGTDITKEKRLQADLKESKEAYRNLANTYQRFMEASITHDPRLDSGL